MINNFHTSKMEGSSIPVINVLEITKKPEKLREISEKWGCFRVVNHGVPLKLMADMKLVVKQLLELPIEIKKRNVDVIPATGYLASSEINPIYEALGVFDVASAASASTFCSQLQVSPQQREVIESYAKEIYKFAIDMASKVAISMGTNKSFESWLCNVRMNKYDFNPETIGLLGIPNHTDAGFLTVLQDDENFGGLQVMNEFGEYVDVDPSPGTLVVNLGDSATLWSNGSLRNSQHRVECKGVGLRYSIVTFISPPPEEVIEAFPMFIDADHPRIYGPITFEAFMGLRMSNNMHAGDVLQLLSLDKESDTNHTT